MKKFLPDIRLITDRDTENLNKDKEIKALKNRPLWSLSKEEYETLERGDEEDVIEFMGGLDADDILQEIEVKIMVTIQNHSFFNEDFDQAQTSNANLENQFTKDDQNKENEWVPDKTNSITWSKKESFKKINDFMKRNEDRITQRTFEEIAVPILVQDKTKKKKVKKVKIEESDWQEVEIIEEIATRKKKEKIIWIVEKVLRKWRVSDLTVREEYILKRLFEE